MSTISQQDIAEKLKLSRATVSRCFTNHPGINPETRARVFELASRLGYDHLTNRTRGLQRRKKTPAIGVLICVDKSDYDRGDYENPARRLTKGVSEYCQLTGARISLRFVEPSLLNSDPRAKDRLLREVSRDYDGLLLLYPFPADLLRELTVKLPCVSLVEQPGDLRLDCVDVDHYQGVALLIDHLYQLGHRRIGFYTKSYPVQASWSLRRMGAFYEKMTQIGLRIREKHMVNALPHKQVDLERSYDLAAEAVASGVTAFVCAADHQAYDLQAGLRKRGIKVPAEVSITGFDGIRPPQRKAALTTVEIPYREIGYMAAKRLIDSMSKRFGPTQHILLGCRLVEGKTSATVRVEV